MISLFLFECVYMYMYFKSAYIVVLKEVKTMLKNSASCKPLLSALLQSLFNIYLTAALSLSPLLFICLLVFINNVLQTPLCVAYIQTTVSLTMSNSQTDNNFYFTQVIYKITYEDLHSICEITN